MLDNTTNNTCSVYVGELTRALAGLARVIDKKTNIPILSHVVFNGHGSVIATDAYGMQMKYSLTDVDPHVPFTVSAKALQGALKGANAGSTCFMSVGDPIEDGTYSVSVCVGGMTSKMIGYPVKDFPFLARGEGDETPTHFTITATEFRDVFAFVAPCMSDEQTRYYLRGIYLHPARGKLTAVATTGHILGIKEFSQVWEIGEARDFNSDGNNNGQGVIMPREAVTAVIGALGTKKLDGMMCLAIYTGYVHVSTPEWELWTRVVDGTFPEYTRVIPSSGKFEVKANRSAFVDAVGLMCGAINTASSLGVCIAPDESALIYHEDKDDEVRVHLGFVANPDTPGVGINIKYLKEGINAFKGTDVCMSFNAGAMVPVVFKGHQQDTYAEGVRVIMTMRL